MFDINQKQELETEIKNLVQKIETEENDFDTYSILMKNLFLRTSLEN